jgi:hypothetical protein
MAPPHNISGSWTRVCGIEINQDRFSAVWGAYNRADDVVWLYAEYSAALGAIPVQAEAIKARGRWIPALIDLDAGGPQERPGRMATAQRLADCGVNLTDVPLDNEVARGDITDRLSTKRLQVYDTLHGWRAEYRTWRREENGKLPEGFGLMRATGLVVGPGLPVAISENRHASDEEEDDVPNASRNSTTGY